jgi:hypothetical protein
MFGLAKDLGLLGYCLLLGFYDAVVSANLVVVILNIFGFPFNELLIDIDLLLQGDDPVELL